MPRNMTHFSAQDTKHLLIILNEMRYENTGTIWHMNDSITFPRDSSHFAKFEEANIQNPDSRKNAA